MTTSSMMAHTLCLRRMDRPSAGIFIGFRVAEAAIGVLLTAPLAAGRRPSKLLWAVARGLLIATVAIGMLAPASAHAQEPPPDGTGRTGGGEIVEALKNIAQVVIDIFIGIAAILMAVGIATGFVGGQFMVTVGQPYGLSQAWVKVIAVVLLGIGAMLTIVIANTIIDIMAHLVPPTVIPTV